MAGELGSADADVLRSRSMNLITTIKHAVTPELPSIRSQTPWECEFFSFGKAEHAGVAYFNSGLVERHDGMWLVARRARNWENKEGFNDVVAFKLDGKTPQFGIPLKFNKAFADQHFEDPRAIYHNSNTFVSCTSFLILSRNRWTNAHQTLSVVNHKWVATQQFSAQFGFNGKMVLDNRGKEKNWLWFFHQDQLHLVYSTVPHTVVPFDPHMQAGQPFVTERTNKDWVYGEQRGGTPPVKVGNEYWSFFHSSVPWINNKRKYHMGCYAFEAFPPFTITRMTSKPLLIGSRYDPWDAKKPACVFPVGSHFKDGMWTVTGGCNDLLSFWIDIPHHDLERRTERL